MIYLIYGAGGMLVVLTAFFLGSLLGWKLREAFVAYHRRSAAQEVTQEQWRELAAQQQAFEEMLRYNQDTAYGITGSVEVMGGSEGQ